MRTAPRPAKYVQDALTRSCVRMRIYDVMLVCLACQFRSQCCNESNSGLAGSHPELFAPGNPLTDPNFVPQPVGPPPSGGGVVGPTPPPAPPTTTTPNPCNVCNAAGTLSCLQGLMGIVCQCRAGFTGSRCEIGKLNYIPYS